MAIQQRSILTASFIVLVPTVVSLVHEEAWPDIDCFSEWDTWTPLRNVLGDDRADHFNSRDWAAQTGFAHFMGIDPTAESWADVEPQLRQILPLVPAAVSSECVAVQAMGDVLAALFDMRGAVQIQWGPVELLAVSRFPIFRTLCAASAPSDGLAMLFLGPLRGQPRDKGWAAEAAGKAAMLPASPGAQGVRAVLHFVRCLMGLAQGAEEAIEKVQDILQRHPLRELLSSSFFCALHSLKLWRQRAPEPRRRPPPLPPEALIEPPTGEPLHVTAAWGTAVHNIRRWVRSAAELQFPALVYCLDAAAVQICEKAADNWENIWCHAGPQHGDVHGTDKYELALAAAHAGRSVLWTDLDGQFLARVGTAFDAVQEIGLVRHARAACLNGGFFLLRPAGVPVIERLVHWLHHFPFGFEQNGLNALARGTADAPFLRGDFEQPEFLDHRLFTTGIDGVIGIPIWLHFWTPPSYNLEEFVAEVADNGHLKELLQHLRREPPHHVLECTIVHAAVAAPLFIRFADHEIVGWEQQEAEQETSWQQFVHTFAGESYENGYLVRKNYAKSLDMYRRAALLGSRSAAEAVSRLDPIKNILSLL